MSATMWAAPAGAGETVPDTAPRVEVFSGADLTFDSMFGYAGAVWAFGNDVTQPGFRVKALAGTGGYDYTSSLPGVAGSIGFDGDVLLAQFLAGYQWRGGKWTLKAYAGVSHEDHDLSPADPANSVSGSETGFAAQLELWRNLGQGGFVSFDASYSSAFGGYWTQARLGRTLGARLSAGVEAGALGNEEYDSARGGGFLRLHMGASDLTLSGGVTGDYYSGDLSGYAAFGLYRKF